MNLKVLGNKLFFQFAQEVSSSGTFKATTGWGFQIKASTDDPKYARWGKVTHVGPEVADVIVGDYVLVEPLMWTLNMSLDDETKVWGTNRDKIVAVSNTVPEGIV